MHSKIGDSSPRFLKEENKRTYWLLNCTYADKPKQKEIWKMRGRVCESDNCNNRATKIHFETPKPTNSGRGYTVHCPKCHFKMHYPDEDFEEYLKQYPDDKPEDKTNQRQRNV